jgi:hypothetical protein
MPDVLDYQTPANSPTWWLRFNRWYQAHLGLRLLIAAFFFLLLLFVDAVIIRSENGKELADVYVKVSAPLLLVYASIMGWRDERIRLVSRATAVVVLLVTISGLVRMRTCQHATYLKYGSFRLAVIGKDCGNELWFSSTWPEMFVGKLRQLW